MYRPRKTPKLRRHKGRYSVRFYDPDTRRRKEVMLGTGSKEIADRRYREIAHAYETDAFDPWKEVYRWGRLDVRGAVDLYIGDYRERNRASSADWVAWILRAWVDSLLSAQMPVDKVRAQDVKAWINRPDLADATRSGYYMELQTFFRWLVKHNHIKANPMKSVPRPKVRKRLPAFFSRDEYNHLIHTMLTHEGPVCPKNQGEYPGYRMAQLTRFLTATGLRIGECTALSWGDVRPGGAAGGLRLRVEHRTKTDSSVRSLPLFDEATAVLSEIREEQTAVLGRPPKPDEPLWLSTRGHRMRAQTASKTFKCYVRQAGLSERFKLHTTRHTFASWLVMAGESLYKVSKLLGHANVAMTEVYAHLSPDFTSEIGAGVFSEVRQKS